MRDIKKHLEALKGSGETLKVCCSIDKDLYKRFKNRCTNEDVKITHKIEQLIRGYLDNDYIQKKTI